MSGRTNVDDLSEIFLKVADAPPERQQELLVNLCPDQATRRKVLQLLDADSSSDLLLDHSLFPKVIELQPGDQVSDYRLVKELALGGMGIVYLAEQLQPIQRNVALKVIKPGVDTREVIARFNAERQALSLMDHPNIAKVFDAGSTQSGRPFFVMELVNGQPITTYCEQHGLKIKQRLELFVAVCRAIQHAHQKGIIHRDIKPSNVLVADYDDRPTPKVIDFGVAKAISQTMSTLTVATGLGQIVGTFDYMSPEQSQMNQQDVDTRSDVYSLGVLLYELLTDTPPFDRERLRSASLDEMLRIIRDEDPPRPSVRLTESAEKEWAESPTQLVDHTDSAPAVEPDANSPTNNARHRQQNIRAIRGELDWVVMKAMDKDRDRRYATADELAADVQRYLNDEAVAACPPTALYRFSKFAQRNKASLALTSLAITSLLLGIIGIAYHNLRITRAESKANVAALEFFVEDLMGLDDAQMSDGYTPDANLQYLFMLRNAQSRVDQRLSERPELKARIKSMLASSFNKLGQYADAEKLYEEYLDFLLKTKSPMDAEVLGVKQRLARILIDQEQLTRAEELAELALEDSRRYLGDEHEVTLRLLSDRAMLYYKQGMPRDAVESYRTVLKIQQRLVGDEHPDTLVTKSKLGKVFGSLSRFEEARQLYEEVLNARKAVLNPNDARLAAAFQQLGKCHLMLGRRDESRDQFEKSAILLSDAVAIYQRNRGPEHTNTLESNFYLAQAWVESRQLDKALPLLEKLVDQLQRVRPEEDPQTLAAINMLGWTYMQQSLLAEAEFTLASAYEVLRRADPPTRLAIQVMGNLAIVRLRMGKHDQAISLDEQTEIKATESLGHDAPETLATKTRLGFAYLAQGNDEQAKQRFEQVLAAGKYLPEYHRISEALSSISDDGG